MWRLEPLLAEGLRIKKKPAKNSELRDCSQ
jgi:hypothetical protein